MKTDTGNRGILVQCSGCQSNALFYGDPESAFYKDIVSSGATLTECLECHARGIHAKFIREIDESEDQIAAYVYGIPIEIKEIRHVAHNPDVLRVTTPGEVRELARQETCRRSGALFVDKPNELILAKYMRIFYEQVEPKLAGTGRLQPEEPLPYYMTSSPSIPITWKSPLSIREIRKMIEEAMGYPVWTPSACGIRVVGRNQYDPEETSPWHENAVRALEDASCDLE